MKAHVSSILLGVHDGSGRQEELPASAGDPALAAWLGRLQEVSFSRPDGRAHAAPILFSIYAEAFWLPTLSGAARLGNVRAHPWLALSVIEGKHDTHAAVLTEGPAAVLTTVPEDLRRATELRNDGGTSIALSEPDATIGGRV